MAVYIGVDLHVRTQTVCWMNTADGEIHQHTLDHSRDDVRAFYAQFTAPAVVGIESSGYALWFHQLIEQAGHRLLVGDAYAIRQFARQQPDRKSTRLNSSHGYISYAVFCLKKKKKKTKILICDVT